jgi:hypothetical protein
MDTAMRKLLTFLIALGAIVFAIVSPVSANGVLILAQSRPAAPTYQGPGDIVSGATAWWGLRGYNGAYAAPGNNPGVVVCDSATFAICSTINILSNGNLDTATMAASSACASACVYQTFKDQSGNGHDATCASAATCATVVFNCINTSLPCAQSVHANNVSYTVGGTTIALTTGFTWSYVLNPTTSGFFGPMCCLASSNTSPTWGITSTVNQGYGGDGGTNQTFTLPAASNHVNTIVFDGASSIAVVDVTTTALSGMGTTGGNVTNLFRSNNLSIGAKVFEFGLWGSTAFNPTQYSNLCHNDFSYWATSVSC